MPAPEPNASLRIHANGGVQVESVVSLLASVDHAYNGVLLFIHLLEQARRVHEDFPFPSRYWPLSFPYPIFFRGRPYARSHWSGVDLDSPAIVRLVPASDRLLLRGVRLESPGFWEFVGKLNPLEVLRQYLNDRHERKKDNEYRNQAERDRLFLENQIRENQVLRERIDIAKQIGASERDLAPLINSLVAKPLERLNQHQDQNLITHADETRRQD